jgi:hypothetical protein
LLVVTDLVAGILQQPRNFGWIRNIRLSNNPYPPSVFACSACWGDEASRFGIMLLLPL